MSQVAPPKNTMRTTLILLFFGVVVLNSLVMGTHLVTDGLSDRMPNLYEKLRIGLILLFTWIVVSAVVRSAHQRLRDASFGQLLLTGTIVAVISMIMYNGLLAVLFKVELTDLNKGIIVMTIGLAFVTSLLTTINLKIANRMLGNLLEVGVIGLLILLLYLNV